MPRIRPRKVGLTRLDAALDAMRVFGFSDHLIRSTIKELLEVYGKEGWVFIEDSSYKVLLDGIIEKVEKEGDEKDDNSQGDERGGTNASTSEPRPGSLVPSCSNVEAEETVWQTNEILDAASHTNSAQDTALLPNEPDSNYLIPLPREVVGKTLSWTWEFGEKEMNTITETTDANTGCLKHTGNSKSSPPLPILSPECMDSFLTRRRRPCHGWISSDDDEDDLVELEPAPLPEQLRKLRVEQRKRKSGWDIMPEDT